MYINLKHDMVRMLVKEGVISPSYLLKILQTARKAGNTGISFGSRQDIMFRLPQVNPEMTYKELSELKIDYIVSKVNSSLQQNIVSSYVSSDILPNTQWLNSGDYLQILDQFKFPHLLRVNITDPRQSLVPLFYGHLNFVASTSKQFWYLYLRLPSEHLLQCWPVLVYSEDIANLSKAIERIWLNKHNVDMDSIFKSITSDYNFNFKNIVEPLTEPKTQAPDYEGFGRMHSSDRYWAGFYWRNNSYDIEFMEELCELCIKTGISKLSITPWKSFIVRDIEEKNLIFWQALDGKYGITMRHSAFELNWHLPLGNQNALRLKKYIVSKFDKRDVCVHGLTFGIATGKDIPFCTVMIQEKPSPLFLEKFDFLKSYTISVADQYNPNKCKYHIFIDDCQHHRLPDMLARITQMYFTQFIPGLSIDESSNVTETPKQWVHQCPVCYTVYLPEHGDEQLNIPPGTPFNQLPDNYCCPLCETEKERFLKVDLSQLQEV